MTHKILIVDDEEDIIEFTQMALESSGYQVICALDGESGLEKAISESPDLILLDVMMPGIDGLEVCRRLKANQSTKKTPVLLVSAKTQIQDVEQGTLAGCDDYVIKPYDMRSLLQKIAEYLAN